VYPFFPRGKHLLKNYHEDTKMHKYLMGSAPNMDWLIVFVPLCLGGERPAEALFLFHPTGNSDEPIL
jgi:hypothetical protein